MNELSRTEFNERVCRRIRLLRELKGITQAELGTAIGVSNQAVAAWERGAAPTFYFISKMAKVFNVSTDYIGSGEGANQPSEPEQAEG